MTGMPVCSSRSSIHRFVRLMEVPFCALRSRAPGVRPVRCQEIARLRCRRLRQASKACLPPGITEQHISNYCLDAAAIASIIAESAEAVSDGEVAKPPEIGLTT